MIEYCNIYDMNALLQTITPNWLQYVSFCMNHMMCETAFTCVSALPTDFCSSRSFSASDLLFSPLTSSGGSAFVSFSSRFSSFTLSLSVSRLCDFGRLSHGGRKREMPFSFFCSPAGGGLLVSGDAFGSVSALWLPSCSGGHVRKYTHT